MSRFFSAAVLLGLCLVACSGLARGQGTSPRARELAAFFDKDKHKVKVKRGARVEIFLEVRAEPAARRNAAEYSGSYQSELDVALDLRVGADGSAEGGGTEPARGGARRFTLRDARVSGAVLTGTKVYEGGGTEPLEAVFIDLTTRHHPTDAGTTLFGLGVVFDPPKTVAEGFELRRLFYALER